MTCENFDPFNAFSIDEVSILKCADQRQNLQPQIMLMFKYFQETDSLYIELAQRPGFDTRDIEEGIVVDIDVKGHAIGIVIDQASKHMSLNKLNLRRLPFEVEQVA